MQMAHETVQLVFFVDTGCDFMRDLIHRFRKIPGLLKALFLIWLKQTGGNIVTENNSLCFFQQVFLSGSA